MTHKLLNALTSSDDRKEFNRQSESEQYEFLRKVGSNTAKSIFMLLGSALLAAILIAIMFLLYQNNEALDKLDTNLSFSRASSDEIQRVSILAAYCSQTPGNNTVDKIQKCIEANIKEQDGNKSQPTTTP